MNFTEDYIKRVSETFQTGNATEHSYRAPLQNYLENFLTDITVINEPKRQACGMPDYALAKSRKDTQIDVGYIEAKDIGVSLDRTHKSDQMKRYLKALDNLVLTDYLEFRFYEKGEPTKSVQVAELVDGQIVAKPENFEVLETLFTNFVGFTGQTIKSPKTLAKMMANKAQLMRFVFEEVLNDKNTESSLHGQFKAFQDVLIHDMDEAQFADVYVQTLAYGLFTARLHDPTLDDFSRQEARDLIPKSNPFLRKLFDYVCGVDLDDRVVWIVDSLCEVYRATDIGDILKNFGRTTGRNDPIVHFYETFLGHYDPKLRKARGVWYTPEPVVNFIVRAIDEVLKTHFDLPEGIADNSKIEIEVDTQFVDNKKGKKGQGKRQKEKQLVHRVQMLDVAAGTGTFTAEAIKLIAARFKGQEGMWSQYVENDLLTRLHGFEILMASYAMCHLKIDMLLTKLGYKPKDENKPPRLSVYLTNSLEEHHPDTDTLFASWLSNEANAASRIKRDTPIMIAYGNPPYSSSSQNKGEWITNLIKDYKKNLNERSLNSLSDDYVKFIRYAEHYIEKAGNGIVAMITNNSFIDGLVHRQMRKHLLETFDHIYIYDLHGDSNRQERHPDGSPDKNVFDIMQGVCIFIMVKDGSKKEVLGQVYHFDSYGSRMAKYQLLWEDNLKSTDFSLLENKAPNYFFVPRNYELEVVYKKSISITELFPLCASGIKTERDHLAIQFDAFKIEEIEKDLVHLSTNDFIAKYKKAEDKRNWKISSIRHDIGANKPKKIKITYKPFDDRNTLYTGKSSGFMGRPRNNVMKHMVGVDNIALLTARQNKSATVDHVFVTKSISEMKSAERTIQSYHIPLYLYPDIDDKQVDKLRAEDAEKRKPNLDMAIVDQIGKKLKIPFIADHENKNVADRSQFSPLDLLDYIYAVLHSPKYRDTYKEFLKIDFPRIPMPSGKRLFWQLVALGGQIRQLHLLEADILNTPITTFPAPGDCVVEKPIFKPHKDSQLGDVWFNDEQYFGNVPKLAWEFYIGGYQPAQKWLKDRKGRELSVGDIRHYQKMILSMAETHRLMQEIDAVWQW